MASGIFPNAVDGGLRPDPLQPNNPTQAHDPTIPPADTDALYYGNGCNARIRPHVINSLISEMAALCDRGEVAYRYGSLQNIEYAVRYIVQRGLPRGELMVGQTSRWLWDVALDPPATRYNDYMTLTLVSDRVNEDYVRININGLGYVPLLRYDGTELIGPRYSRKGKLIWPGDIVAHIPFQCAYYQGAFYLTGWMPDPPIEEPCTGCPGEIVMWGAETPPWGAYECNGQVVAIEGDEELFDIIGFRFGRVGDTHFRMPDLRGQFVRGWSHGSGFDPDALTRTDSGDGTTGDRVGTRQLDDLMRHTHPLTITTTLSGGGGLEGYGTVDGWFPVPSPVQDFISTFAHPGTMTSEYQWANGAFASGNAMYFPIRGGGGNMTASSSGTALEVGASVETRPKNVYLMFIIWR